MSDPVTVVISAAGMGTRLGMNIPKALVPVGGKAILARQLEMLTNVDDVVVVAGFRSQLVIDLLRDVRPDVRVALNHDFASTGTAASVVRGAALARGWVLSLDGDLLVRPDDLWAVLRHPQSCVGLTPVRSEAPVWARRDATGRVVGLSQSEKTDWEWSGLAKIDHTLARGLGRRHVFEGLAAALPMDALMVDCVEVDELADLHAAEAWAARIDTGGAALAG